MLIEIVGKGEKTTVSGFGTYPIQTQFKASYEPDIRLNIDKIEIDTLFPLVWERYFNDTLKSAGFEHRDGMDENDYNISVVNPGGNQKGEVLIQFTRDSKRLDAIIERSEIFVQIAPGWVE
jgi:hypothetical protein